MKRISRILGPLLGFILLVIAVLVLINKLEQFTVAELLAGIRGMQLRYVVLCASLTAVYYVVVTAYDVLAFRYIGHPLPYRRIALASFVACAISHNIGLTAISSGGVRYRIHSSFGLTAYEIGKIVLFSALTVWVGFLAVSGVFFTFFPVEIPESLPLPAASPRVIGVLMLGALAIYCWLTTHTRNSLKIGPITIPHVTGPTVLRQIAIGACDWVLGSLIVYSVLPASEPLSLQLVLGSFLLAQVIGLLSQVPGGIGVFESVILLMLSASISPAHVLGSLLVYRVIFYVLPLLVATILLATHEVWMKGAMNNEE